MKARTYMHTDVYHIVLYKTPKGGGSKYLRTGEWLIKLRGILNRIFNSCKWYLRNNINFLILIEKSRLSYYVYSMVSLMWKCIYMWKMAWRNHRVYSILLEWWEIFFNSPDLLWYYSHTKISSLLFLQGGYCFPFWEDNRWPSKTWEEWPEFRR